MYCLQRSVTHVSGCRHLSLKMNGLQSLQVALCVNVPLSNFAPFSNFINSLCVCHFVFNLLLMHFACIYVNHLPFCMKCAVQINLPGLKSRDFGENIVRYSHRYWFKEKQSTGTWKAENRRWELLCYFPPLMIVDPLADCDTASTAWGIMCNHPLYHKHSYVLVRFRPTMVNRRQKHTACVQVGVYTVMCMCMCNRAGLGW